MFESDATLAAACNDTAATTREALAWLETTTQPVVKVNAANLEKRLRKSVVRAVKLEQAARRKMCVGVFGASQAGKSYLISALARKSQNPLVARFGAHRLDYIAHINPEGGKESTGLVTRFSVDQPAMVPPTHPVRLGLLSEIDVVKVLTNSYAFDVLHLEDAADPELGAFERHVFQVLDTLGQQTGATNSPITVEDVYDLEDYCNTRLRASERLKALRGAGKFWDEAATLLPRLNAEGRLALYALLWEELPVFTELCQRLITVLGLLGHGREAWCAMDGLLKEDNGEWGRAEDSIINVSTLNGLGDDGNDRVSVLVGNGAAVEVGRAELTALIAELKIYIEEQPFPFFQHTDLLDFPGARTRKPQPKIDAVLRSPDVRTENFLRGKVAYLFERYCEEQELSAMLLCVGPSNQEVATLPGMIDDWIISTHGATPAEREQVPNGLFFVMTKFDTAFEQGAGKGVDGSRWTTRIEASLLNPFRRSHGTEWVSRWNTRGNFNNVFWVRNPNIRQDQLFDYESAESPLELRVRDDKVGFIETLKQAYLQNDDVRTYVADAEVAWDAGMQLNDGGISRLAERLAPICRPDMKRQQVAERLRTLRAELTALLVGYHVAGDIDSLRAEKTAFARKLLRLLANCYKTQRLGEFQQALRLDESLAHVVFQGSERAAAQVVSRGEGGAAASVVTFSHSGGTSLLEDLGLDLDEPEPEPEPTAAPSAPVARPPLQQDLAQKFIADLEEAWSDQIGALASDKAAMAYLQLDGEVLVRLGQELLTGAQRLSVIQNMEDTVRAAQQFKASDRDVWIWRQVSPAAVRFNDYLAWLGQPTTNPQGSRLETLNGSEYYAFPARPVVVGQVVLDETVRAFDRDYFTGWLHALQALIRGNAEYQAGFSGNAAENARLGGILHRLDPSATGAA